jgi:predicted transcriptional regulator
MAELEDLKERSARLATSPRIAELERLLVSVETRPQDTDEREFSALSMLLVDAILDWDEPALDFAIVQLQRISSILIDHGNNDQTYRVEGRLLSLIDVGQWGMERIPPIDLMGQFVEPDSRAHEFLKFISEETGRSNSAIAIELDVIESEVSRIGRRLVQAGLARKRKVGRTNQWIITPRGLQVVAVLDAGGVMRPTREHRQLQL